MKNFGFAATVGALVLASLGAVASAITCNARWPLPPFWSCTMTMPSFPVTITPTATGIGRLRSDPTASSMQVNSVPDATGHIAGVKSVEFRDRYGVVDPQTTSISTYKPYVPMIGATRDCLGSHAGSILGHPPWNMFVRIPQRASSSSGRDGTLSTLTAPSFANISPPPMAMGKKSRSIVRPCR